VCVNYLGCDASKDELIFKNSPRLAKYGFYTFRSDIPMVVDESVVANLFQHDSLSEKKNPENDEKVKKFFDQYEEGNIEEARVQRWANT
jgi:hypothetical protein